MSQALTALVAVVLAVLIATGRVEPRHVAATALASGCLFGTLGLILAAPLLSAAVHVTRDLARAKAQALAEAQPSGAPESSSAAATS